MLYVTRKGDPRPRAVSEMTQETENSVVVRLYGGVCQDLDEKTFREHYEICAAPPQEEAGEHCEPEPAETVPMTESAANLEYLRYCDEVRQGEAIIRGYEDSLSRLQRLKSAWLALAGALQIIERDGE